MMSSPRSQRFTGLKVGQLAIFALGLTGPVLAFLVERLARDSEQQRIEARFDDLAAGMAADVERELAEFEEQLYSLRAFFDSSVRVERDEFSTFTRTIRHRHPGILACEWAPRVLVPQSVDFEQSVAAEVTPPFRIKALNASDPSPGMAEPADRYPVFYVEPPQGNEAALGLDLNSEPVRRRAVERALRTGELSLSDPIELVQGGATSLGALAMLSVHDRVPVESAADPAPVRGLVLLVFRYADFLDSVLGTVGRYSPELLAFRLVQTADDASDQVLYHRPARPLGQPEEPWTWRRTLTIGGVTWAFQARPTPAFLSRHSTSMPLLWGLTVLLTVALLFGGLLTIMRFSRNRVLQQKERVLRSVLRSLREGVIVADRRGRIQILNQTAESLLGREAGGLVSELASAWRCRKADGETSFAPDDFPLVRAMRGEMIELEETYVRSRHARRGKWLSISGGPLVDESGTTDGGVIAFRDVTARRRSEAQIRQLSNAVEQTADHILITDRSGRILYVNPAFEKTTGYSSEEVLGQTPRLLKSGAQDQEFYRNLWSTILAGKPFRSTTINRKKSGELYYAEQTITPMRDESGSVTNFVAVCKDMTERRERELQDLELELAASVQGQLYPQAPPELSWLEVDAVCRPASMTCGDYYDFIPLADGSLCIAIGDVSGHGLGPALIMAETRAYLRMLLQGEQELGAVMKRLNAVLTEDLLDEHFVTLLLVRIDPQARELTYVNAGHPAATVCDASGQPRHHLEVTGMALGLSNEATYASPAPLRLHPGELVLMVTDGVLEARAPDGTCFGMPGLFESLRENHTLPVPDILRGLRESLGEFTHGAVADDDETVVLCRLRS